MKTLPSCAPLGAWHTRRLRTAATGPGGRSSRSGVGTRQGTRGARRRTSWRRQRAGLVGSGRAGTWGGGVRAGAQSAVTARRARGRAAPAVALRRTGWGREDTRLRPSDGWAVPRGLSCAGSVLCGWTGRGRQVIGFGPMLTWAYLTVSKAGSPPARESMDPHPQTHLTARVVDATALAPLFGPVYLSVFCDDYCTVFFRELLHCFSRERPFSSF